MKMVAEVQEGDVQGTITHVLDEQLALGVRSKSALGSRVLLGYVGNRTTAVGRKLSSEEELSSRDTTRRQRLPGRLTYFKSTVASALPNKQCDPANYVPLAKSSIVDEASHIIKHRP